MGNFYQTLHLRHPDDAAIHGALADAVRRNRFRCWIAPRHGPWITLFPHNDVSVGALARGLSETLKTEAVATLVHDSDVFYYLIARNGAEIDEFASDPAYFGSAGASAVGNPDTLAHLLAPSFTREQLERWFADRDEKQPEQLMEAFHELLGIGPALTSYDYLDRGERTGIAQWSRFIHLPDRAAEKPSQKALLDRIRATKLDFIRQGHLRFDSTLKRGRNAWQHVRLHGAHPTGGFVCSHFDGSAQLAHWQPPDLPRAIAFAPNDIPRFGSPVAWFGSQTLVVSTASALVALNLLTGEQRPFLPGTPNNFDLADPTSATGYFTGAEEFAAVNLGNGERRFTVPRGHTRLLLHPTEPHVLWWTSYENGIVDKLTGAEITRRKARNPAIVARKRAQWRAHGIEPGVLQELDRDDVLALEFTPDGEFVLAGTTEGLRVFRYRDLLKGGEQMPEAYLSVDTTEELQDHRCVNALTFDSQRNVVIYSRGDDSIQALHLSSGKTQELSPALDQSRAFRFVRSGNLMAVWRRGYLNLRRREDEFSFQVWDLAELLASAS